MLESSQVKDRSSFFWFTRWKELIKQQRWGPGVPRCSRRVGRQKAGGQNERVEVIWKKEGKKDRQRERRRAPGERAKGGQIVGYETEGGHMGRREGRNGNKSKQREKEQRRGTGIPPTFDTSSKTHTRTHTHPHEGQEVSVSNGTAARSVTLYISEERDSNTRGPRRSP